MAISQTSYPSAGVGPYTIPFPYLVRSHVEVLVNGVVQPQGVAYTFPTASSIQFATAPAAGTIVIRRNSSQGLRLTNYQDGSKLGEAALDFDVNQAFFVAQEALDAVEVAVLGTIPPNVTQTAVLPTYLPGANGTNNIVSPLAGLTTYATGQVFAFVATATNTGPVTLNINSLGPRAITKVGTTPLVAGDLVAGSNVYVFYDGTQFQMINVPRTLTLTAATVGTLTSTTATVTDTINERTNGAGVTIDGVLLRDGNATVGTATVTTLTAAGNVVIDKVTNLTAGAGSLRFNGHISRFESTPIPMGTGTQQYRVTHGGTRRPDLVRAVMRRNATTAPGGTIDASYVENDEVTLTDLILTSNHVSSVWSNTTEMAYVQGLNPHNIASKTGGGAVNGNVTPTYWNIVLYAFWL